MGKSKEGADAYPPLMLLKYLLLQKCVRPGEYSSEWVSPPAWRASGPEGIPSDPELEDQIPVCRPGRNDRISFKKFLGLPLDKPSPDHSTFSRFRSRLSEKAMRELNSEVLGQFARRGLKINEGIAVDARLVKSASRPLSNDELRREREKRERGEADTDRDGNPIKFRRDLESDWTVKNDKPHFGLKEHVSVDVNNGFLLATKLTSASEHDSKYLPYLTLASCHTEVEMATEK